MDDSTHTPPSLNLLVVTSILSMENWGERKSTNQKDGYSLNSVSSQGDSGSSIFWSASSGRGKNANKKIPTPMIDLTRLEKKVT